MNKTVNILQSATGNPQSVGNVSVTELCIFPGVDSQTKPGYAIPCCLPRVAPRSSTANRTARNVVCGFNVAQTGLARVRAPARPHSRNARALSNPRAVPVLGSPTCLMVLV